MGMDKFYFFEELKAFSQASMDWCIKESENASTKIVQTIEVLLEDTARVSQLSQESLEAVDRLKNVIENKVNNTQATDDGQSVQTSANSVIDLIIGLRALCKEHDEINTIISPILQALQFQDRMTQNLGNMIKMLGVWMDERERIASSGDYDDEAERAFGNKLFKITTMSEERDAIHAIFPAADRPQESQTGSVELF